MSSGKISGVIDYRDQFVGLLIELHLYFHIEVVTRVGVTSSLRRAESGGKPEGHLDLYLGIRFTRADEPGVKFLLKLVLQRSALHGRQRQLRTFQKFLRTLKTLRLGIFVPNEEICKKRFLLGIDCQIKQSPHELVRVVLLRQFLFH